jgi:hypothetical protein
VGTLFKKGITTLGLMLCFNLPALPCTCVTAVGSNARTAMIGESVVFRGTVLKKMTLPLGAEMKGRNRYAITFGVDEFWKGAPGRTVTIYGLDDGTDCLGGSFYQVGKSYLVYASEQEAKDVRIGDLFRYEWTDILAEGTKMLMYHACTPGGKVPQVNATLRQLGKGRVPATEK